MNTLLNERGLVPEIIAAADGTVIAWSLWEHTSEARDILHYMWVAQPIRRCGFGARILREHEADRNMVVSHWSDVAERAYLGSVKLRQLLCTANSPIARFSPTLCANPDAFVAM